MEEMDELDPPKLNKNKTNKSTANKKFEIVTII